MKASPIGSVVLGHDNNSYAFRDVQTLSKSHTLTETIAPDMAGAVDVSARRCPKCNMLKDKWSEPLKHLKLRKRRQDFSITYDGISIASTRFLDLYSTAGFTGLVFRKLVLDPAFSVVTAARFVEFDAVRRKTVFVDQCELCSKWKSVSVATPALLKYRNCVSDLEFVRTDVEFGTGDEQTPLILCGLKAAQIMKQARLRGLVLLPITNE